MRKSSAMFLQAVVVLVGLAAVAFLIWEPQVEGVNANATNFEIYFQDPFLAYAYIASLSFFTVLYQAFKVLGLAGDNMASSPAALTALRTIKYCAMAMIGFVVVGEIIVLSAENAEPPPAVFMGLLITLGAIAIAVTASKFARRLQKSGNELAI